MLSMIIDDVLDLTDIHIGDIRSIDLFGDRYWRRYPRGTG